MDKKIAQLIKDKQGIRLDIGCGDNKQQGFVGMDIRPGKQVDIVHDVEKFPWPLPDECTIIAMASHLLEHIEPHNTDSRTRGLIKLLSDKKLISEEEIAEYIGEPDPGPIFMRFMDEVWRIMKPGGQFMFTVPYAGSAGFWQDPTHCNGINQNTMIYFDPDYQRPGYENNLYRIYHPKPWKILQNMWNSNGNLEVALEKRVEEDWMRLHPSERKQDAKK